MHRFDFYCLIIIVIIMIPNILYDIFDKTVFENKYHNKAAEFFEQIGRYGCLGLIIFNIPGIW